MAKLWIWVLALLCALSLFFSVFLFTSSGESRENEPLRPYILRDWSGKLALFRQGESQPVEVYELYTHLLPQTDIESLRRGIPLENEVELDRILEDFGA